MLSMFAVFEPEGDDNEEEYHNIHAEYKGLVRQWAFAVCHSYLYCLVIYLAYDTSPSPTAIPR